MDWNEYSQRKQEQPPSRFDEFFQRFLNDPKLFWQVLVGLFVLALVLPIFPSSFRIWFTVRPEEKAVVTRFGRYLNTLPPGIHLKLPFGIDQAHLVKTEELRQEAFGFYLSQRQPARPALLPVDRTNIRRRPERQLDNESLMLTGDLNVADVNWVVQYKVSHPRDYLFNVAEPEQTIRDIAQAAMRQVVGDRLINDVITTGKAEIETAARDLMQEILSEYGTGVTIWAVKLQDVTPPEPVIPSFNEVNAALQEQKQAINKAEAYQNRIIPEARGKAEQVKSEARGYATALLNRARGEAERFSRMEREYRTAPDITRTRLYLDLYEELLQRVRGFTIVDPEVKGIVPIFPSLRGSGLEKHVEGIGAELFPDDDEQGKG